MSWLDNYSTTNTFRSIYINGFIDISGGRLQTRSSTDGHLMIAGDASLNGNLYVGGDISWNPNSLANNSIPSSAIIGGAVGATGPAGTAGTAGSSTEIMLLTSTGTNNGYAHLSDIDWDMHGTADMLGNPQAILGYGSSSLVYNGNYTVSALTLNFKPGVYKVTFSGRFSKPAGMSMGFDLNNNNRLGFSNLDQNEEPLTLGGYSEGDYFSYVRTFVVPHLCNFHLVLREVPSIAGYAEFNDNYNSTIQLLFERTGIPTLSGTDDDLHSYGGIPIITQRSITGGLYWGSTVTKPTDQDEYLDLNESGTAWIYRIDPTSSVEVASFHSDADLSLNKRLFVGEDVTLNKRLFVGEDVSLNGNVYMGGDISWNPTSLANDSIPSSVIIKDFMLLDAVATGGNQGIYNMNWNIYGNQNLLADNRAFRCSGNPIQGTSAHAVSLLFNPGIYRVTCTFCMAVRQAFSFAFDINDDGYFSYNGAYSTSHHVTDLEPLNVSRSTTTTNEQETVVYMFVVPHVSNFHIQGRTGNSSLELSFVNYSGQHPQFMFERIGEIATSGTDSVLSHPGFYSNTIGNQDSVTITNGIYW